MDESVILAFQIFSVSAFSSVSFSAFQFFPGRRPPLQLPVPTIPDFSFSAF
jgi:hypothetical protein